MHLHPCEVCGAPVVCTGPCIEDVMQEMVWCEKHKKKKKKKEIVVDLKKAYNGL